ncbi:PAS domain S-box-containing protein [Phyllobacterium ifriqiyense]
MAESPGSKVMIDPAIAHHADDLTKAEAPGENAEAVRAAMVAENLYGCAWALDASGQFTYATATAQALMAMTLSELNLLLDKRPFLDGGEQGWQRSAHPQDREKVGDSLRRALRSGQDWNCEYRILRADGSYVWHRAAARPIRDSQGRITGWYGSTLDIDVYMRTEPALVERERLLQQLIDTVPALFWSTNANGTPAYINKPFTKVIGASLAAMTADDGSPTLSIVHPEDREAARQAFHTSLTTGIPYIRRYRQIRKDGSYRWTESRAKPLRDEHGTIVQWYGVSTDIHDLVTAQDTIEKRERFLWQLVAKLPAMIDCADANGEPIFRSQQLQEFLGYDLEELDTKKSRLAATLDAAVHPDDLASVKEIYAHSLATGEPYLKKHRLRRFDGVYRWVETRAAPMRDTDGTIVQWNVICLDIDGEVRAQENLLKAQQRLASASQATRLAEVSASIAHEVNQPLSAVINYSVACQRWLAADPPNFSRAQRSLEQIIHSANSAVNVVGRIRALFEQATDQRDCTALTEVVFEVKDLLTEEGHLHGARIVVTCEAHLRPLPFDRVQIQQVLFNLMRNGLDAMAGSVNEKLLEIRIHNAAGNIQVEISDRGKGIAFPEKIFEPFFTTKEQGMGMGLAICRTIIEAHGGELWAERNEPEGAKFIFTLPVEK